LYRRAKIPAIIKRIDELIRAISRGEKVTVKLIPREKVISAILAEEFAIVGVEPRVEGYVPVEIADLIVPLLVESGMQEKEAYALVPELKRATPSEREKLLESIGVPGELSAKIIQTIEEFEEKREPMRKSRGEAEREPTEEIEEEPKEEKEEREVEEPKEPEEDKEPEEQK
jgi:predicted HAD superfamily phosphohydrolase